jgi:hypothetical protein
MTGWNCQPGGRPLQGPSPILCEQPDGTALTQPDRPVTNVMPRNSRDRAMASLSRTSLLGMPLLPGRMFSSPADFNTQLAGWLGLFNRRHRRVLGCAPADRVDADRAAMLGLPPVAPATGWRQRLRLPRDHYVRLDANDFSVDLSVIGRRVEVIADLERVRVRCDGRLVADHARCWARHQTISDPDHARAAARLRTEHRSLDRGEPAETEVEQRCLGDYDTVFGLTDGAACCCARLPAAAGRPGP